MSETFARLDLQGGLAGDMFVAAMLDTWPELTPLVGEIVESLPVPEGTSFEILDHHDRMFGGKRLVLTIPTTTHHQSWRTIRRIISEADLSAKTRELALAIFLELAKAEAAVHNKAVDDVVFHEVGAWDSILDIVLAAALIEASGIDHWSVSPVPLGHGSVQTMHGLIAVPAPAVRLLLDGFPCVDDGIGGERVTPTGAAIIKTIAQGQRAAGKLVRSGAGFGSKKFEGTSNCVWLSVFAGDASGYRTETIGRIAFEVDDASPEELALGLERLRQTDGVIDVVSGAVTGKKGRMAFAVRLLCTEPSMEAVVDACFLQTPTLGLRAGKVTRYFLEREEKTSPQGVRVKIAHRPGAQKTAKAEIDDVASAPDRKRRMFSARQATEPWAEG